MTRLCKPAGLKVMEKSWKPNSYLSKVIKVLESRPYKWFTLKELREELPQRFKGSRHQMSNYMKKWVAKGLILSKEIKRVDMSYPVQGYRWSKEGAAQ